MFEYDLREEDACRCIVARGRVDALSAPDIQKLLDRLVLDGERLLLVDMASVNYVSSAGLRVFLAAQKQLTKVGGEIIFIGMNTQVFKVFRMSGLTNVFRIAGSTDEVLHLIEQGRAGAIVAIEPIEGARMEYVERARGKGTIFAIGSPDKTAGSAYGEKDVVPVEASRMQFGCGLATLGERYEEYKELFGESMVVKGSFFFYPAVKHSSVDFLVNAEEDPGTVYRFLHGFGFDGPYRYLISFEGRERPLDLTSLAKGFFAISAASVLGVVIIAESKGLWGMHLKKAPLMEQRPDNGKSIFDDKNFSEWVDFPVEPTYANHAVVATGIAVRDRESVSPQMQSLMAEEGNFHIHGAIFEKTPLNKNTNGFDGELLRIFNELQVYKIQHILGRSRFSGGMAAIIELDG
ncbi:STAS domain-containing protein [Syntrophorhabdus aromaticivorans]|uniref:STAS domain-containing protein n=1 Tax=Syntrophorhabdus aromaticivorans TaxID=328301 RepID=UPI0003F8C75C|nr:STAS domain-containing protein [Syntrophorhabdus aromaticivorans]